jgi:3-oxoacyl-[acyl-carrier-protein] synthase-3
MLASLDDLTVHLLRRLRQVQQRLGLDLAAAVDGGGRFADLLDSMGLVEFLAVVADDCRVEVSAIETCAGQHFGTVADLAGALHAAGIEPQGEETVHPQALTRAPAAPPTAWLAATAIALPQTVQPADTINAALGRPPGWLERHAGIVERRLWAAEDPLAGAVAAARACLEEAGLLIEEVGALLVTSEAPPLLAGLAAALHHRLDLRPGAAALEVGGACTGFLGALWLARHLLPQAGAVLVLAVEAPSRFLSLSPGPAGEVAALFGEGAAAGVLCAQPVGGASRPLMEIVLSADGAAADLLRIERGAGGEVEVLMQGQALAGRAVRRMAELTCQLAGSRGLAVADLVSVVAHGGNGRMPALLARALGLPAERVWSETPRLGNLGSASLPAAWAARWPLAAGPVAWVAAGAGLTAAGAILG